MSDDAHAAAQAGDAPLARALVLGVLADGRPRDLPEIALEACPAPALAGPVLDLVGAAVRRVLPAMVERGELEQGTTPYGGLGDLEDAGVTSVPTYRLAVELAELFPGRARRPRTAPP
ncbi:MULTISPECIES: hypothetical protein [Actinomadura]|uniref:Uncharacterized protein n=1 Tax=Actinomadura yumaensis TaxID=111807 RepID=A0ABW2CML4_9ACTN|nr:hypothetical protein [Actinomadura sp. J1-007]MWK40648.1 hypothetical protein [Actinomadura sp. J1-007]